MNEFQKAQRNRILNCYSNTDEIIEKAKGVGSKGGKVIGYTKGGHPIYDADQRQKISKEEEVKSPKKAKKEDDPKQNKKPKQEDAKVNQAEEQDVKEKVSSGKEGNRWNEINEALGQAVKEQSTQMIVEVGELMSNEELATSISEHASNLYPGSSKIAETLSKVKANKAAREESSKYDKKSADMPESMENTESIIEELKENFKEKKDFKLLYARGDDTPNGIELLNKEVEEAFEKIKSSYEEDFEEDSEEDSKGSKKDSKDPKRKSEKEIDNMSSKELLKYKKSLDKEFFAIREVARDVWQHIRVHGTSDGKVNAAKGTKNPSPKYTQAEEDALNQKADKVYEEAKEIGSRASSKRDEEFLASRKNFQKAQRNRILSLYRK